MEIRHEACVIVVRTTVDNDKAISGNPYLQVFSRDAFAASDPTCSDRPISLRLAGSIHRRCHQKGEQYMTLAFFTLDVQERESLLLMTVRLCASRST